MSIFQKHMATKVAAMENDGDVVTVPVIDDAPVSPTDPLEIPAPTVDTGDDSFAEQRARRNAEVGTESFTQVDAPVDGKNDNMTIGEVDTDVDLPTGEFHAEQQIDQELDQFEQEEMQIEQLQNELGMLADSAIAIEQFGINPTALAIMQTTGLLDNTALSSLALESVGFYDGNHAEAQMALEGLGDKIKDKAAAVAAKILSVVKSAGDKVMGVLTPLFDKISAISKKLASATWDKANEAGTVVRAHPYATIASVIAAVAAVGAIVALTASGSPAPGAKIEAVQAFVKKIVGEIGKIKVPFGKVTATIAEGGTKFKVGFMKAVDWVDNTRGPIEGAAGKAVSAVKAGASAVGSAAGAAGNTAKEAGAATLGWSKSAVSASTGQLDRAWGQVKTGWSAVGTRMTKVGGEAVKGYIGVAVDPAVAAGKAAGKSLGTFATRATGSSTVGRAAAIAGSYMAASGYAAYLMSLVTALFALTRAIVVGGFRIILGTYRSLTGAAGTTAAA